MTKRTRFEIQDFASPTNLKPEVRIRKLSRDIEEGLDSDRTWIEFVECCIELGRLGAAASAVRRIQDPEQGPRLCRKLESLGVIAFRSSKKKPGPPEVKGTPPHGPPREGPSRGRASRPEKLRSFEAEMQDHARKIRVARGVECESLWAECKDATEYLLLGAMPLRVLGLTLLFPAAVALGLLLPGLVEEGLVAQIQLFPPLLATALFLAYTQEVFLHSARGEEDPPDLFCPDHGLISGCVRAGIRAFVLATLFLGPALSALLVGQRALLVMSLFLVGFGCLPMAWIGVSLKNSWEGLLPKPVLQAMAMDFRSYLKLLVVLSLGLFLPLGGVYLLADSPLHNLAAFVGPLTIGPGFWMARLLGRWSYAREQSLRRAFGLRRRGRMCASPGSPREEGRATSRRRGLRSHDAKASTRGAPEEERKVEARPPKSGQVPPRRPKVAAPGSRVLGDYRVEDGPGEERGEVREPRKHRHTPLRKGRN